MKIAVVGNGAIGLQSAWALLEEFPEAQVVLVAPRARPGCASLAAAAMFNSFAEVEAHMLENHYEREKFAFNRAAAPLWPALLEKLRRDSGLTVNAGFGTYLVNNAVSDVLEDENYDAIHAALVAYNEPFDDIDPTTIPHYKPSPAARGIRAMYIKNEGWVNPIQLVAALDRVLQRNARFSQIDARAERLAMAPGSADVLESVITETGEIVGADCFIVCPGATFTSIVEKSDLPVSFQRVFYGVGASLRITTGSDTLSHCIRTPNRGLSCGAYAAPQDGTSIVVGASNFISPWPVEAPKLTSILTLLEAAIDQINTNFYRAELHSVQLGWRPTSSDTLPMVGACAIANMFVATGTRRDGLHCSPLIAGIMVDLVRGTPVRFDIGEFRPDRALVKTISRDDAVAKLVRHTMNAALQHNYRPARTRQNDDLAAHYTREFEALHDAVGAGDWGIPTGLEDMYRYGHIKVPSAVLV